MEFLQSIEIDMERSCDICKKPCPDVEVIERLDANYHIVRIVHWLCAYPDAGGSPFG
jgi:hypothetical protein